MINKFKWYYWYRKNKNAPTEYRMCPFLEVVKCISFLDGVHVPHKSLLDLIPLSEGPTTMRLLTPNL